MGSGFRPWRKGGLVAYIEDLMDEQVHRGDEVAYFFSGRRYPLVSGPRLRRWRQRGVAMFEVVNSPLYDHGRQPELEVAEPRIDRMFESLLGQLRPDAVHVQELAGLPSSILDVIWRSGTPAVMTLQDYFPLCSTFKLLDADGRVCLRREIGTDCVATNAADARPPGLMIEATLRFHMTQLLEMWGLEGRHADRVDAVARRIAQAAINIERRRVPSGEPGPSAYQRRRDVNIERLNRAQCLVAMSSRVAEIYSQLGVDPSRMRTLHLTLGHIERLRPRRMVLDGGPLTFGTLAGFESTAKGGHLLIKAMRLLNERTPSGRFRLLVFGHVDGRLAEEAKDVACIEVRGGYSPRDLDRVLDEVDVGIMSSVWEEAYGYAGVEFLAKGIPVIANALGGMTDYTREGQTGWLNRSCSAEELASIMADVIERPEQAAKLNAGLAAFRDEFAKPMSRHGDEMETVYHEASQALP